MNSTSRLLIGLTILATWAGGAAQAQETVVISKSRLEELERKEAGLERLQRELRKTPDNGKPADQAVSQIGKPARAATENKPAEVQPESALPAAPPPAATKPTQTLSTLGPLQPGQIVDAADLQTHYRSAPNEAAKRYEQSRIRVAGEIVGFDKPVLVRHATISLKTVEQDRRVVCRLDPPPSLPNLFTVENGDVLVGSTSNGARSILAKVGQRAVIEGWCQGLKGQGVTLTSAKLINVH